jgi:hypothetical protein
MTSARAGQLLEAIAEAHDRLCARAEADAASARALRAVHEAFAAAFDGTAEEILLTPPGAEEWSMAEVAEHVAEHDGKYVELERLGIAHYVEHGLEHALQLWRLRSRESAG